MVHIHTYMHADKLVTQKTRVPGTFANSHLRDAPTEARMGQSELLEAGRGAGKGWHWVVRRPEAAREGSGSPKPETEACFVARGRGLQVRGRGPRSPRLALLPPSPGPAPPHPWRPLRWPRSSEIR